MRRIFWSSWWLMMIWTSAQTPFALAAHAAAWPEATVSAMGAVMADPGALRCGPSGCPLPGSALDRPHPAVCRLIHTLPNGVRCIGSGVLVDKEGPYGLVITCQHLFQDGRGTTVVIFPNGRAFEAQLVQQDAAADLAVLLIARPEAEPVSVASKPPQPGEPVRSCGYGPDGRYGCNQGRVVGYVRTGQTGWETLELTGRARQGDSGGPVFNAQGELAAVLWGTDGRTVTGTYCGRVDRFLQQTGRYLFPWNAKNDPARQTPTNPPTAPGSPGGVGGPGCPAGCPADLSRIETRLDRILELLRQGWPTDRQETLPGEQPRPEAGGVNLAGAGAGKGTQGAGGSGVGPLSSGMGAPGAGTSAEEKARWDFTLLHQAVQQLVGEVSHLPERVQARLEKVQAAGAQSTPEMIRAYAQDFLAEKLADGSLGWTVGKLLAAALGLSGPVGLGLTVGAWLIARRIGRKVQTGEPLLVQQLASRISSALASGQQSSSGANPASPAAPQTAS